MPEQQSQPPPPEAAALAASREPTNAQTLWFMVALSTICALILGLLATLLEQPKEHARDLDRSKQMMIAARILDYDGRFLVQDDKGQYRPARYAGAGRLEAADDPPAATNDQILDIYRSRLLPMLVDDKGALHSFTDAGVDYDSYVVEHKKSGYYKAPLKLIYQIMPNPQPQPQGDAGQAAKPVGWVIPVNGFGLWDAIYGYLGLQPDGNTIINISWYEQKETPGLGAVIAEEQWQRLFPNKKVFQANPDGSTDFASAPVGIVVVKGKVNEVLGDSPKAKSAVDGMAGATLTGNGVTAAYRDVLSAYRPFLLGLHRQNNNHGNQSEGQ